MPDDAGVIEKGVGAFKDMQIRAAYACVVDAHEHLAWPRAGARPLDHLELSWLDAEKRAQWNASFSSSTGPVPYRQKTIVIGRVKLFFIE